MTGPTAMRPQRMLFIAAACCSAVALPLWVTIRQFDLRVLPAHFVAADWHGYEMLFGYALAVVAGFLIGPVSRLGMTALASTWVLGQIAALLAPFSALHAAASALFAIEVAAFAMPKLLRGPSKLQNRAFGLIVFLLCVDAAVAPFEATARAKLLLVGLDLYVALLVLMGGRLIAAAAAGQFYRRGDRLDERVQPRIEGGALVCLLLLGASDLLSLPERVGSVLAVSAGLLLIVRWLRWRLWTCLGAWNLSALGAGYLWLAIGLAIRASRSLPFWALPTDALHGLTAGALGSLTLLVMGRARAMASGLDPEKSRVLLAAGGLVHAAALVRLLAGVARLGARSLLLPVAGAMWAGAFATLAGFLVTLPASPRRRTR